MKISQLIAYRESLENLRPASYASITQEIDSVIDLATRQSIQFPSRLDQLRQCQNTVAESLQAFDNSIDLLQKELQDQIDALEPEYFAQSYRLYENGLSDHYTYVQSRRFIISEDTKRFVQSRIQAHSSWHYPGMLMRPGHEEWVEYMVACDPFYIVDTDHDLLWPVKDKFNPQYQARLRYYVIKESDRDPMMTDLPDGQFGFCFFYNFFNYKPFEIMRRYLEELYQKLRPGGVLVFTFSDCDRKGGAELAERMANCYTPGRMILPFCESIGFTIELNHQINAAINWVELRKPGTFNGLRGGQSLAQIIPKPQ